MTQPRPPARIAPTVLTVEQVAERWACSRSSVYKMVKAGGLRAIKQGRLIRISCEVVREIEQCGSLGTGENGQLSLAGGDIQPESESENIVRLPNGRGARSQPPSPGNPPGRPAGRS